MNQIHPLEHKLRVAFSDDKIEISDFIYYPKLPIEHSVLKDFFGDHYKLTTENDFVHKVVEVYKMYNIDLKPNFALIYNFGILAQFNSTCFYCGETSHITKLPNRTDFKSNNRGRMRKNNFF